MLTLEQIRAVAPAAPSWVLDPLNASLTVADASTPPRAAMYLAQLAHESRELTVFVEGLSYSADAIQRTWPLRFPTLDSAQPFARNPVALASRVYADRLGNGDEQSGDGWRYRGRGAIQITGCNNYLAAGLYLDLPLRESPDLAALPAYCFQVSAWFWRVNGLNAYAEHQDLAGATRRINGGLNGLASRNLYYQRALEVIR